MISLFNQMGGYENQIDEMKFWLISNKRTNSWSTSIATTSAIYALSLGSSSSFKEGQPIISYLDNELLVNEVTKGINYAKNIIKDADKISNLETAKFSNPNNNKAWANVHLQFFQDYEDIQRTEGQFLDIKKEVYFVNSDDKLINVGTKSLQLGDRIRVRLIIESDRPIQFMHISDDRPGGAEPVITNSGYQWASSLGYYLSVKDIKTHFFVDNLPKGQHIVEYDMFINNLGEFNSGVAEIQSFYAPEFNDYSKSVRIVVE
jgi:hypothetical protein